MTDFLHFIFPGAPVSKEKQIAADILATLKGGEGSGNFGHAGRPGEVGGSARNWSSVTIDKSKNYQDRVKSFANANGFDTNKIIFEKSNRSYGLGNVIAEYIPKDGSIHVYPTMKNQNNIEALMAHEITHALTADNNPALIAGIKAVEPDKWKSEYWRAWDEWGDVSEFANTIYSTEIHKQYPNWNLMLKEHIAELGRLDYEGKLNSVSDKWQEFYRVVMEDVKK